MSALINRITIVFPSKPVAVINHSANHAEKCMLRILGRSVKSALLAALLLTSTLLLAQPSTNSPDNSDGEKPGSSKTPADSDQQPTDLSGFQWVVIRPGCFQMGSTELLVEDRIRDEWPARVCITKPFELAKYEVTQLQWQQVMGSNPSSHQGCDHCPVEQVSWHDAKRFIGRMNQRGDAHYRLPTEAEWEYAARAGTVGRFYTGDCIDTGQANYDGRYDYNDCGSKTGVFKGTAVTVGRYPANPWGLHDMYGNVMEWVEDGYANYNYSLEAVNDPTGWSASSFRVLRGGGWFFYPGNLRSANRSGGMPSLKNSGVGFRLVRDFPVVNQ